MFVGDDDGSPLAAGRHIAQPNQPHTVDHDRITHTDISHVDAVETDSRHHEHARNVIGCARGQQLNAPRRVEVYEGVRAVGARRARNLLPIRKGNPPVVPIVDLVACLELADRNDISIVVI